MTEGSRQRIIDAALEALRTKGYAGSSARVIAGLGGFNAALIFYYFDSVDDLLVSAFEASSAARLERYQPEAERARAPSDLLALLEGMYREDADSGHIRVVSELVAASVARPELAPRVLAQMEPWVTLAQASLDRLLTGSPLLELVSTRELALAATMLYTGANLIGHLLPERSEIDDLFAAGRRAAPLLDLLGTRR